MRGMSHKIDGTSEAVPALSDLGGPESGLADNTTPLLLCAPVQGIIGRDVCATVAWRKQLLLGTDRRF